MNVMSTNEIRTRLGYLNLSQDDVDEVRKVLIRQDDISFKAGYEQRKKEVEMTTISLADMCLKHQGFGRQQVMEWLDLPHNFYQILRGEDPEYGGCLQTWKVDTQYIEEVARSRGKDAMYLIEKDYDEVQSKLKEWNIGE